MAAHFGVVDAVRLAARGATLGDLWDRLAATYGARTAFSLEEPLELRVMHARELSFDDLLEVIARMAGGARRTGRAPR
jgi:hypothetical protein